jgi:hybrid polyketide synthase/nonribosomal peptide synthetase FtdB
MDSYRISESFLLGDEHIEAFERELGGHLRRHTGSEVVAQETLDQAREYLHFCSRTPNLRAVAAPVSVISDREKVAFYSAGERGTWHGSSTTRTAVFRGFGTHAEMLDQDYVALNASLARDILTGVQTHAA